MIARRLLSTAARTAKAFPERGIAHGGHPNVLQVEGNVVKTWFNPKATPEIVPVAACVMFACGLGLYKMTVVDTLGRPMH